MCSCVTLVLLHGVCLGYVITPAKKDIGYSPPVFKYDGLSLDGTIAKPVVMANATTFLKEAAASNVSSPPISTSSLNSTAVASDTAPINTTLTAKGPSPGAKSVLLGTGAVSALSPLGLMTYNVQALPFTSGNTFRLAEIGRKIAALPDMDVVAFQEVFEVMEPEARAALVRQLSASYPYFSPSTHTANDGSRESSGSAIFSRLPFMPLKSVVKSQRDLFPIPTDVQWLFDNSDAKMAGYSERFLFMPFEEAVAADALAAKGLLIALVDATRKFTPTAPLASNRTEFEAVLPALTSSGFAGRNLVLVATTHAQSENTSPEAIAVRRRQFVQIQKYLKSVVSANFDAASLYGAASFAVVLLGDLNEDAYWSGRESLPNFLEVLGSPLDLYAIDTAINHCSHPPCIDSSCVVLKKSGASGFTDLDTVVSGLVSKDNGTLIRPSIAGDNSWQRQCGFTCCLNKSGTGSFDPVFKGEPERLDYVLLYGLESDPKAKLSAGTVRSQVMYSDEWLMSDHLALVVRVTLTVPPSAE